MIPRQGFKKGSLKFELRGQKLRGRWALVRIRGKEDRRDQQRTWLLVKERDAEARAEADFDVTVAQPESVTTGRGLEEIAAAQDRVWHSNRTPDESRPATRARVSQARPAPTPKPAAARRKPSALPARVPKAALPAFVSPQLATLVSAAPTGDQWLHEMKFDGFRILGRLTRQTARCSC